LLEDRRFADYVAERLARAFVGVENGPFIVFRRQRFVSWLSDQLLTNTPYNEIVHELISGKGLWTDTPSVNFLTITVGQNENGQPDPERLAARTTRAFLGMRIDCLQCHDNNLTEEFLLGSGDDVHDGMQQDFQQLAAFYTEARMSPRGISDTLGRDYNFQYLYEKEEELVPPVFPYLANLQIHGASRREKLATWVTHKQNRPFSRAIVNRVWALMFGKPLVEPIDDIPLTGFPKNHPKRWWKTDSPFPPGMEQLADDLVKHDYDLQRLIRIIASTSVFQLDSRDSEFVVTEQHQHAWAVFPLTRLRPEQMVGSIIQSCSLTTIDANAHVFTQILRDLETKEFIRRYGDTGEDEFGEHGGTIPQRLIMMNGKMTHNKPRPNDLLLNAAGKILKLSSDDKTTVEVAFLVIFSRRPSARESAAFEKLLAGTRGRDRREQIEELYRRAFSTTEFAWSH
jgi:hypothetical protein